MAGATVASIKANVTDKIFKRWGCSDIPELNMDDFGKALCISLGLGAIFNEDAECELAWMQSHHNQFKTRPITMVYAGRLDEVLELVNRYRHL